MLGLPQKDRVNISEVMRLSKGKIVDIVQHSRFSLLLDLHIFRTHVSGRYCIVSGIVYEFGICATFFGSVSPAFFLKVCCI